MAGSWESVRIDSGGLTLEHLIVKFANRGCVTENLIVILTTRDSWRVFIFLHGKNKDCCSVCYSYRFHHPLRTMWILWIVSAPGVCHTDVSLSPWVAISSKEPLYMVVFVFVLEKTHSWTQNMGWLKADIFPISYAIPILFSSQNLPALTKT